MVEEGDEPYTEDLQLTFRKSQGKTNRRDGRLKKENNCRDGISKIDMRDKWMQSINRKKKKSQTNRSEVKEEESLKEIHK